MKPLYAASSVRLWVDRQRLSQGLPPASSWSRPRAFTTGSLSSLGHQHTKGSRLENLPALGEHLRMSRNGL